MPRSANRWSIVMLLLAVTAPLARAQPEVGMNAFACSLYGKLAAQHENLFFSPFSASTALAMAAEGARFDTARQMGEALGLDASMQRDDAQRPYDWSPMHESLGQLAARLAPRPVPAAQLEELGALRAELDAANATLERATSYDQGYFDLAARAKQLADEVNRIQKAMDPTEFRSANALWLEKSFEIEQSYVDTLARHYGTGGVTPVDFRGNAEAVRVSINDWVSTQTNQRIQDLLARGMVDESTRLVLTNAVYFLGEWLEPFDKARTRREKFHVRDGSKVDVELMRARKSEGVRYAAFGADGSHFATPLRVKAGESDGQGRYPEAGFQIVELPYRGDALSMQLILPMSADGLPAVEAMLSASNLARWSSALEARSVDVELPKFRLETGFELSQALQQLGMTRAFTNPADADNGAQFDGISASSDPSRRLYIGGVVHKAFVQVDEKGTEAAAATAVSMLAGSAMPTMVAFTPLFRADRAFIFLIRENDTGAVVFLGRLTRPERS